MYRILFSLLLLLVCSCFDNKQKEKGVVVTNTMWQSEVIVPMKEALERLAVVSPKFGADTECVWAANQVVMLSDSLDGVEELSSYDAMYDIYTMQMYIAYGLAYLPSLMSLERDNEIAHEGVDIVNRWQAWKEDMSQEKRLEWLAQMSLMSLYNYTAFYMAYDEMSEEEVFKANNHYKMILEMQYYMDGICSLCPNDTVGYQHCCVLEASAFFMTYFPLLRATYMADAYEKEVDGPIMETAYWFDSLAALLQEATAKGHTPKAMSELEFFEFMKESTRRKVQMLDFLTKAIDRLEPQEEE